MNRYTQNINKSLKISRLKKQKSYGHYCNLCKKYNYDRLTFRKYTSSQIMFIEYKFLNEKGQRQAEVLKQLNDYSY